MHDYMKEAESEILTLMKRRNYRPLRPKKLSGIVVHQGYPPDLIDDVLSELEESGMIVRTGDGRLALPHQVNRYIGRLSANPDGYGFVQTVEEDIYVNGPNLNGAMHNDEVMIRLTKRRGGRRREGTVIKILERANEKIVGVFRHGTRGFQITPLNRRIFYSFVVPPKYRGDAVENDIVSAKILEWPENVGSWGTAEVTTILGSENNPAIAVEVIISEHALRTHFSQEVMAQTGNIPIEVEEQDVKGRKDLREEFTVTIDGLDAKDFDDAISITGMPNGFLLKVHIADVSRYVPIRSPLDLEAKKRGFSVYLPDRVLPMLPERLSNQTCSLNPRVDRLSVTAEMRINEQGEIRRFDVYESVIRSNVRLTYEEVDKAIETGKYPNPEVKGLIELLLKLSDLLEKKRIERGSLNFETVEPKIIFGPEKEPIDVKIRKRTPATSIIEECMIVTNEAIAAAMHRKRSAMIYRIHDTPDEEQMKEIAGLLDELHIPEKVLSAEGEFGKHQRSLQKIIRYVHGRPEENLINNLLLRAMKQARYSPALHFHYGLASRHYTHFTSPIRRYPDLIVHRLVKSFLIKKASEFSEEEIMAMERELGEICDHCSVAEREGDSAEREATDALLCRLLLKSVGDVFEGVITGVTDFGIFVQLPNTAEGLIRARDMKRDFFRYEPEHHRLKGMKTGYTYKLGERVVVRVISVNVLEQRIDLMLEEDAKRIVQQKV